MSCRITSVLTLCSQRLYLLSQLNYQNLSLQAIDIIFQVLILSKITCALPAFAGHISVAQKGYLTWLVPYFSDRWDLWRRTLRLSVCAHTWRRSVVTSTCRRIQSTSTRSSRPRSSLRACRSSVPSPAWLVSTYFSSSGLDTWTKRTFLACVSLLIHLFVDIACHVGWLNTCRNGYMQ